MKRVLLIIGGGMAAVCLDLIRRLKERGIAGARCWTRAAQEFVTPLSVGALTNDLRLHPDLFDLMTSVKSATSGLSREADLIVVAPATAEPS